VIPGIDIHSAEMLTLHYHEKDEIDFCHDYLQDNADTDFSESIHFTPMGLLNYFILFLTNISPYGAHNV
jgi:hypothetical protein